MTHVHRVPAQILAAGAAEIALATRTKRLFPTVPFERATERPPYVRFEPDYAEGRAAVSSRAASRILIPFLSVTMLERVRLQ